jgi:hypothetical protein
MASRAHVHDYYGLPPARERRAVRYPGRNDPVILPRDTSRSANTILIASGLIATAVIVGGAFAVYAGVPPPPMAETRAQELASSYQLDDQPLKAQVVEALGGPARAVPSVGTTAEEPAGDAGQYDSFTAPAEPALPDGPAITPRRTAPEALPAPTAPDAPPREPPYPDPITTPPDAVAPPNTSPEQPLPLLDPENPYR